MTKEQKDYIRESREMYEFSETDEQIMTRHKELYPRLTEQQKQELDPAELIECIDDGSWALTLGGVYIEPDGNRNFGGGSL